MRDGVELAIVELIIHYIYTTLLLYLIKLFKGIILTGGHENITLKLFRFSGVVSNVLYYFIEYPSHATCVNPPSTLHSCHTK